MDFRLSEQNIVSSDISCLSKRAADVNDNIIYCTYSVFNQSGRDRKEKARFHILFPFLSGKKFFFLCKKAKKFTSRFQSHLRTRKPLPMCNIKTFPNLIWIYLPITSCHANHTESGEISTRNLMRLFLLLAKMSIWTYGYSIIEFLPLSSLTAWTNLSGIF